MDQYSETVASRTIEPIRAENVIDFLARANEVRDRWFAKDEIWGLGFAATNAPTGRCALSSIDYMGDTQTSKETASKTKSARSLSFVHQRSPKLLAQVATNGNGISSCNTLVPRRDCWRGDGALIGLYFAVKDNPGFYDTAVRMLDQCDLNSEVIQKVEVIPPTAVRVNLCDVNRLMPWLPKSRTTGTEEQPARCLGYRCACARRSQSNRTPSIFALG